MIQFARNLILNPSPHISSRAVDNSDKKFDTSLQPPRAGLLADLVFRDSLFVVSVVPIYTHLRHKLHKRIGIQLLDINEFSDIPMPRHD